MPMARLARWLLIIGAVLCIPAAVAVIAFWTGVAASNALAAAPICASPTHDSGSSCLSLYRGQITDTARHQMTVGLEDTSVVVSYDCSSSPWGACRDLSTDIGAFVETGWFRGKVVLIGPPDARPAVITDDNPEHNLLLQMLGLFTVIPPVALLLSALFLARAPMTLKELVQSELARWPDPPREVDREVARRVAWAHYASSMSIAWTVLYFIAVFVFLFTSSFSWAAVALVGSFAISFGLGLVASPQTVSALIRNSPRRSFTVDRIQTGFKGEQTKVWYRRVDGKQVSKMLNSDWYGQVKAGDTLDVLADPRSGEIDWVLKNQTAQA